MFACAMSNKEPDDLKTIIATIFKSFGLLPDTDTLCITIPDLGLSGRPTDFQITGQNHKKNFTINEQLKMELTET